MNPVSILSVEAILVDLPTIRAHQLAMAVTTFRASNKHWATGPA